MNTTGQVELNSRAGTARHLCGQALRRERGGNEVDGDEEARQVQRQCGQGCASPYASFHSNPLGHRVGRVGASPFFFGGIARSARSETRRLTRDRTNRSAALAQQ